MNKILSRHLSGLLLLMIIAASSANGQGYDTTKWRFSNPKPIGFTTFDVDFFDDNNVLAVGTDGAIARSGTGGKSWTYASFTFANAAGMITKSTFYDVHFITSSIAYAVGSFGSMVKSTDGGRSWNFVTTPLFANGRNINTVWFINKDTGYIGGQWNSLDSIPKVYFTKNGGATWDSLASPVGGKTRVGYINNVNLAPLVWDVTGKGKEIQRIEFSGPNVGYIIGGGQVHFPPIPAASSTAPCNATGGTTTTSANNAALVWKYSSGTLIDYSLSKERLGYSGINTNTVACNTQYNAASITPVQQTYKAMNIINDSMIVIMSFNNNIVVRIRTGVNDNTVNLINGLPEPGKYEILNFPFPPTQGPQAGTPIPATQVLLASNPYHIRRAANGKLNAVANNGLMWTSVDTGKTWVREFSLPQGQIFSSFGTWALDIAPNGRFLSMGSNGVFADSIPGVPGWTAPYRMVPGTSSKIEFADCLTGISAGGSVISVTTDGGNSWADRSRPDFAASFYNINGMSFPNITKSYYAVSNGTLYRSVDNAQTLDPLFSDFNYSFNDVAAVGNDTIYLLGYSQPTVPTANRRSTVFRSFNNGSTWQAIDVAVTTTTPAFTAPTLREMSFPSKNVGYVAGTRNAIYKTIDGGSTWSDISPFPSLNFGPVGFASSFVTYTDVFALDDNTVFAVGNMFTNVNNRRIYRSTDGGTNWTDISGNINAISSGNINGVLFHDINNGYVILPGGVMLRTINGGTNWTLEVAPTGTIFTTLAFSPRRVPAGISFANRKVFVSGVAAAGALPSIMEYGSQANVNVNSTETKTAASCTNATAGSITVNATGGLAPYTYSINGGPFQAGNTFTGLTQGVKTITIKDAFCGTLTKQVNVDFDDNLTLNTIPATDTTVCAGASVPLIANSAATTYAWSPSSGLSNAAVNNPTATVTTNTAYTVTATLNGCVRTKAVQVNIKPNPVISAGIDKTIVEGDIVQLQGSASNPLTIAWTPAATLTGANTLSPMAKLLTTTNYTLTVKDGNGCTSTDDVLITVIPYCLKPMEAFTPNGDGQNDRWMASTGAPCASNMSVSVVNRYGNIVYKNDKYQNNWDGTYNGKPIPDGTYYFIIHYQLINGSSLTLKGNVTIIR